MKNSLSKMMSKDNFISVRGVLNSEKARLCVLLHIFTNKVSKPPLGGWGEREDCSLRPL